MFKNITHTLCLLFSTWTQLFAFPDNWTLEYLLSLISIVLVVLGGICALIQWCSSNRNSRNELIQQIIENLRFNKDIAQAMYTIEYNPFWYNESFHNNRTDNHNLEFQIDKLLSYLSYLCYLKQEKRISKKEFRILQYEINRVCVSFSTQAYLWNLYHFSQKQQTACSFQYLINYALKHKLINRCIFENPIPTIYPKYLNF